MSAALILVRGSQFAVRRSKIAFPHAVFSAHASLLRTEISMAKSRYHDLVVWQKSRVLASTIYRLTQGFPRHEVFGLTQQLRRAAVSVVSNIAEGQGRQSVGDILRFLVIARGSLYEIEAQTIIAADLDYLDETDAEHLGEQTLEAIRLINGLIRHYQPRAV